MTDIFNWEKAARETPRPEYPRPDFVRSDWLNLNGVWEFSFDKMRRGFHEGWHNGQPLPDRIVVPFAHQYPMSGVDDQGVEEVVWYARTFEVPPTWIGNPDIDVLLHFGAVDYKSTIWINGREVGHNRGGQVPFTFDIAPYLQAGENRVTLYVEDPQDPYQPRGKQAVNGVPRGCDYYCTTGIWQTVWLEPVPVIRIQELRVEPHVGGDPAQDALEMRVFLHAPALGHHVRVQVTDAEGQIVADATVRSQNSVAHLRLPLPNGKRWSPTTPHLYDLRVTLLDGEEVLDEITSYTGLRSVEIRADREGTGHILLNGEPIYLAMVLDQGYWPDGGMTAPSDEALRADVEWIKKFGFNGVRKHQKVEDPRWLYWCDKLGLLVWGEMANARAWSAEAEEAFLAEWERAVRRDANHPCIITWVPLNESWGVPSLGKNHPGQYAFVERVVTTTRRLDPSRPVVDNDGWEHTDIGDIFAVHDYTSPGDKLKARYPEAPGRVGFPATTGVKISRTLMISGGRFRGQPVILSEVGGFLTIPPGVPPEKLDWLYNVYGSSRDGADLLAKYRDLMQGIASLSWVSGFCYTQLTDIEQEINGLLTYDRQPKVAPEDIAAVHQEIFGLGGTQEPQ